MFNFRDIALCLLGAAVVVDTALLLVLAEGRNRRRVATALLSLLSGALMFHMGFWGSLLFSEATAPPSASLQTVWVALVGLGGLIMPSAQLHWLTRLSRTGLVLPQRRDLRYLLFYLPVILLPWVLTRSRPDAGGDMMSRFGEPYLLMYVIWVVGTNSVTAVGLFLLRGHRELKGARRLLGLMVGTLLLSTLFLFAYNTTPATLSPMLLDILWLAAVISPVLLSLLFGYFIVRFNFMQIVLERTMLYAVVIIGLFLVNHFFWQEYRRDLSARYRIDFSMLAAAGLALLLITVEPTRKRMSEALRYLLGERMERLRHNSRALAFEMSTKVGEPTNQLLDWFCLEAGKVLGFSYVAAWQVSDQTIRARGGDTGRLADPAVLALFHHMIDNQISLSTRRFWQTERSEQALIDADAAMIICLDHQRVSALFAFGRSPARALNEEQVTAGRMLVEQLGITITSSYLQMERLAAERRLQDQTKLSMMGMVASAVAHEVKNPLSSIKTISTLLAEELGPDSQYNEELTLIRGEVDRLSETVTQMLGFVRPGTQRGDTVSLESFLKGAVRLMQHMAKKRGVSLTFECADPVPEISSASGNVRDIFLNLIGNAIDAAETADAAGGQVAVRIQTTQTEVNVSIEDNGPGISPADVPKLFEPFYTTKATGTGLGLAIAKERADEVGATIACRPGNARGTVFTVTFPIKDEPK